MRYLALILFVLSLSCPKAGAQVFRRRHALPDEKPPKAILLQLETGYSRLKRGGNADFMRHLVADMKEANRLMIMDFQDNFKFCPVYYFYDSNRKHIINGELNGYLIDAQGQPLTKTVLQPGDTSYFILHFGYMQPEGENDLDMPLMKRVLIASNYRGHMLPSPLPNTSFPVNIKKEQTKKYKSTYRYNSKVTDIHYRPRALQYGILLRQFYSK